MSQNDNILSNYERNQNIIQNKNKGNKKNMTYSDNNNNYPILMKKGDDSYKY